MPEQPRMTGKCFQGKWQAADPVAEKKGMRCIVLCCGLLKDLMQCEETLCQKRNSVCPL